jgi:hypothetical protein
MRRTYTLRARPASRSWPGAAAIVLVAVLTACSGSPGPVRLPARPPAAHAAGGLAAAHAAGVSTPATSVAAQVIGAFTAYTIALDEADKSRNAAVARSLLRPYLAASRIDGLVQAMSSIWSQGQLFYGQDVLHISSLSVSSGRAFVHDCDDTSGMGLEYAATGQAVPGSAGIARENVVTRLDLVGGRWLVQFQLIEDTPCAA